MQARLLCLKELGSSSLAVGRVHARRVCRCAAASGTSTNGTGASEAAAAAATTKAASGQQQGKHFGPVQPPATQVLQPHQYRQKHPLGSTEPMLHHFPMQQFEVESETPVHQRYLTVYNRKVRFSAPERPTEVHSLEFDVVGHPRANFCFTVTFPFHPYKDGRKGGEVTLIREYAQGPNALMYCLPTGALDPKRHAGVEECAARELSEEAWLAGGRWHRLLPLGHAGLPEVKWCMNRFVPFLVVDPQPDLDPGSRDAEEASMEVLRMPLEEFKALMVSGEMLLPSITTAYLAMDKLREQGLL